MIDMENRCCKNCRACYTDVDGDCACYNMTDWDNDNGIILVLEDEGYADVDLVHVSIAHPETFCCNEWS